MEDDCAVTQSSCWEATVDHDFLHHFCIISTLLPFRIPIRTVAWLVNVFCPLNLL